MTNKELESIYRLACEGRGFEPSDGQFKLWKQTLGWCEEADLSRALVYFFQDQAGFPMPADLRPLVERAKHERLVASSGPKEFVEYVCPACGTPFSVVTDVGDKRPRICLVTGHAGQLVGCRVRLQEIGRGYKIGSQKRA